MEMNVMSIRVFIELGITIGCLITHILTGSATSLVITILALIGMFIDIFTVVVIDIRESDE